MIFLPYKDETDHSRESSHLSAKSCDKSIGELQITVYSTFPISLSCLCTPFLEHSLFAELVRISKKYVLFYACIHVTQIFISNVCFCVSCVYGECYCSVLHIRE